MSAQTRAQLYTFFEAGDRPTAGQFADLIDSSLNLSDTAAQEITSDVSCLGSLDVGGNFRVSANATVTGNLIVSGNATFTGNLGNLNAQSLTISTGIVGNTTGNPTSNVNVGGYISSEVSLGAAVNLVANNPTNVTSIQINPGDYDLWGVIATISSAGVTSTSIIATISMVSAANPGPPNGGASALWAGNLAGAQPVLPTGAMVVNVSATATAFLVAENHFSGGVCTGYGGIYARRRT